jgi:quinol monooxygenase YgiN
MLSVMATLKLKEDKLEEATAFFKELATSVLADEPGTLAYVVHQRRDDPHTIIVYEKYESDEAFALHGKNLAAKGAEFMAVMDGPPTVVVMDEI